MAEPALISWEDAVRWYRRQPGNTQAVLDNYFDLPVLPAVRRFAGSEESREMLRLLGRGHGRTVLDLGAGHGVTSYAMAAHGWKVTALEPDPSEEVGYGAIAAWQRETGLPVEILTDPRPPFPIRAGAMDAVIARQVLHHVPDLTTCLNELARVLRPGGMILTTRDHVADDEGQLAAFLAGHPLQSLYGGENAFPLSAYLSAFCDAGFELLEVWGPLESILNFFPGTEAARRRKLRETISPAIAGLFPFVLRRAAREMAWKDRGPGRIYSIFARKPVHSRQATTLKAAETRWLPPRKKKKAAQ